MSRESDAEFRRQIERELDHASWRSVRPLFLAMVLVLVSIWAITANSEPAPADAWDEDCVWWPNPPTYSDGKAIEPEAMVGVRVERSASPGGPYETLATVTQREYCYRPSPLGTNYYRLRTVMVSGVVTEPGPVISTITVAPPAPTMLVTVGGDVFLASPNWTNFSWKLGAKAGTVAAGIKCDPTRRIGEDYFLVKGPIVWTAGKKNYVVARCEQS